MNKVPSKIKISYLLVEIFEPTLNISKRPLIENIGILYNNGSGVRGTNAQRLPSQIWEHSRLCQDLDSSWHALYSIRIYSILSLCISFNEQSNSTGYFKYDLFTSVQINVKSKLFKFVDQQLIWNTINKKWRKLNFVNCVSKVGYKSQ